MAPPGTTCIPINGQMVVRYASKVGKERSNQNVGRSILNLLERGMTQDDFVTDQIVKLVYIANDHFNSNAGIEEKKLPPSVRPENTGNQIIQPKFNAANIGIGVSIITMAAVLMIGTSLLIKRKIRKMKEAAKDSFSVYSEEENVIRDGDSVRSLEIVVDDEDEDDDEEDQSVPNPAKLRYDSKSFQRRPEILSTISEASEETDSSVVNSDDQTVSFQRILSESTYEDDGYV